MLLLMLATLFSIAITGCFLFQDLQDLDPNAIMVKQLKQMDKERKEKDIRLKTQEKKVCIIVCSCTSQYYVAFLRLTIWNVLSVSWKYPSWRNSMRNRFKMIVSSMNKRKRRRYQEWKGMLTSIVTMVQVTSAIREREEAVATKGRLDQMLKGKEEFVNVLNDKHKQDYQVLNS